MLTFTNEQYIWTATEDDGNVIRFAGMKVGDAWIRWLRYREKLQGATEVLRFILRYTWMCWLSVIHQIVVGTIHPKSHMWASWWSYRSCHGIAKVIGIHHLGTMHVCRWFTPHGSLWKICFWVGINRQTGLRRLWSRAASMAKKQNMSRFVNSKPPENGHSSCGYGFTRLTLPGSTKMMY